MRFPKSTSHCYHHNHHHNIPSVHIYPIFRYPLMINVAYPIIDISFLDIHVHIPVFMVISHF